MESKQIAHYIDHTALTAEKTEADILKLCDEAIAHQFFSVCINSGYIPLAKQKLAHSNVKICTGVGLPLGANLTSVTAFETEQALAAVANEIDMVILKKAIQNTFKARQSTEFLMRWRTSIKKLIESEYQMEMWKRYQKSFRYVQGLSFEEPIVTIETILSQLFHD